MRHKSYGQDAELSLLDKLGQFLSGINVRRALLNVQNFTSLADVGSGFGANVSKPLWGKFDSVHIFDFKLDSLVLKGQHANISFHEGDVLQTIRKNHIKFDFIILNNALEHFDEPVSILSELHSQLSKKGVLFVNVPSWKGKYFLEIAAFRFNLAPFDEMEDHKRYYNKQQLWLELRNAGFLPSQIRIKSSKFGLNTSAILCI